MLVILQNSYLRSIFSTIVPDPSSRCRPPEDIAPLARAAINTAESINADIELLHVARRRFGGGEEVTFHRLCRRLIELSQRNCKRHFFCFRIVFDY